MYNDIATMIGSLGFPIFACCALGWYIYKMEDKQTEALTKLTSAVDELLNLIRGGKLK